MKRRKRKWKKRRIILVCILILIAVYARHRLFSPRWYSGEHFHITQYKSDTDADQDGIDDQTDILESVRAYLATKPKYKSEYYVSGYPDDGYGVCTDVVAYGMLGAGYDLRELVDEDIARAPEEYPVKEADNRIDFRRVVNLNVYFSRHAISLTTDCRKIEEWQAGDIVVWKHHVGVVSDKRNKRGVPFVLHHASPTQRRYEEDILEQHGDIIGHYRVS